MSLAWKMHQAMRRRATAGTKATRGMTEQSEPRALTFAAAAPTAPPASTAASVSAAPSLSRTESSSAAASTEPTRPAYTAAAPAPLSMASPAAAATPAITPAPVVTSPSKSPGRSGPGENSEGGEPTAGHTEGSAIETEGKG